MIVIKQFQDGFNSANAQYSEAHFGGTYLNLSGSVRFSQEEGSNLSPNDKYLYSVVIKHDSTNIVHEQKPHRVFHF